MQQHFGSINPTAGTKTRPQDDYDDDGLTNLEEWLAGTEPASAASSLKITDLSDPVLEFSARPYEVYELRGTANFSEWSTVANPSNPTNSTGTFPGLDTGSDLQFFQVRRVP